MNFEFHEDAIEIGNQIERLIEDKNPMAGARKIVEGQMLLDRDLWEALGGLGWLGIDLSEDHGGAGLGFEPACLISEKLGKSLAGVPFATTVGLVVPLLEQANFAEKAKLLEGVLTGKLIAACVEIDELSAAQRKSFEFSEGVCELRGLPVSGGAVADLLLVVRRLNPGEEGEIVIIDLRDAVIDRTRTPTLDASYERTALAGSIDAGVERISLPATEIDRLTNRVHTLRAFEQLGGADGCLYAARDYSLERSAFGRPIGAFQAIKHKLARAYTYNELARSNCYFALWAITKASPETTEACANARLAATRAFAFIAREGMAVFGGMGITFEANSHLFLRRSKAIEVSSGGVGYWSEKLIGHVLDNRKGIA